MDQIGSAIIDFTEAAYDLEPSDEEWLPAVVRRGLPVLDQGLGVAAIEYGRPPDKGDVRLLRIHVAAGPEDFPERHATALAATPPEALREQARPGLATTMSESTTEHPEALELYTSHVETGAPLPLRVRDAWELKKKNGRQRRGKAEGRHDRSLRG